MYLITCLSLLSSHLSKWTEYILFACLLLAVCIIFSIMAYFYTYIDPAEIEAQFKKVDDDDEEDYKFQRAKLEMVKNDHQVKGASDETKL